MARTSLKAYASDFAIIDSGNPSAHQSVAIPGPNLLGTNYDDSGKWMLCKFDDLRATLGNKRLYEVKAVFQIGSGTGTNARIWPLKTDYDKDTVTYNNAPEIDSNAWAIFNPSGAVATNQNMTFQNVSGQSRTAKMFLKACAAEIRPVSKSVTFYIYTVLTDTTPAYFEIFYDNTEVVPSQIVCQSGPTGGYNNPRNATDIRWDYEKTGDYYCAEDFTQASATFYWKETGDESYTAVQISGTTKGVTIPANTFPIGSDVQWYVEGTDTGGTTSQTPVYSFSTSAGTVSSIPASPINTIESNNEEITFEWSYTSADGFPPSRYVLEWRERGEQQWNVLINSTNVVTSYTAPANTFPSGEIQWGVLPYNIDGVAGRGSVVSFISYGAPDAPTVSATEVPYLTVSWQASDQQAYKVTVDGKVYGPYFGIEKTFDLPEYLEDGTHTITVNIMGTYALWSQDGSVTVTIANDPGEDITLSVEDGIEPILAWETEEETGDFYIYRNGKLIGHTAEMFFYDRFAEGQNSYLVVNKLPSGNYSISGEETGTVQAGGTCIAALAGGNWIQIDYSRADQRDPEFSEEVETAYNHLAGYEFPSAVIGSYQNTSMSFSALFLAEQEPVQKTFRSLFGKQVIMKLRDGSVYVGIIDAWTRKPYRLWYTEYSFTLRRIAYEDYIDDTT